MSISEVGSSAGITALRGISVNTVIPDTLRIISCHANLLAVSCYLTSWIRYGHSHSIIIQWTPNVTFIVWLNLLVKYQRNKQGGWWWDNENSRGSSFKQIRILNWLVKEFVVKTLAPPSPQNSKNIRRTLWQIYPGYCKTRQCFVSLRHGDLKFSKLKLTFSNSKLKFSDRSTVSSRNASVWEGSLVNEN